MKYQAFYSSHSPQLDPHLLKNLDAACARHREALIAALNRGAWTPKQKKRQKTNILPNIALYRAFQEYKVPKSEARELVRAYAYARTRKIHRILKICFRLPGFARVFRFLMRKGMAGTEIWISEILANDSERYAVDVLKCLWADTCTYFDCYEICEIFCLCDHIIFGGIDAMAFERTETLGMSGTKCDFCFRFHSADRR